MIKRDQGLLFSFIDQFDQSANYPISHGVKKKIMDRISFALEIRSSKAREANGELKRNVFGVAPRQCKL